MTTSDPQPPPRKTHRARNITLSAVGALIVLIVIAAALGGGQPKPATTAATATTAPATAAASPAPAPPPVANPEGKYQGSCGYTLGSDPVGGTAVFVGEIDLTNTGNVGTIVHTRITWPQEGYAPITMKRTVRAPYGQTKAIRFHYHASGNQVDLLQSWQEGHNYADGCTYHVTMTSTFGPVQ